MFVLLIVFAAPAPVVAQAVLQNAFPNLTFSTPVALCAPPDQSDRLFILNQQGIIYVVPNLPLATSSKMFLNISDVVSSGGELGLLGIAFHPNYQNNGYFYIYYTIGNSDPGYPYASVLSRFKVSSTNPDSADRSSEVVLMRVNQPFSNHKAGQLAFGPVDGYLYISFGDGGSGGDPFGNGQNLTAWLGKILRINVDSAAVGLHYSFPPDNPFVNDPTPGIKKEIYAYGLRNPWRYSFDHTTHTLWVGDVGQDKYEEIDTIVSGGDYGWNIMEGLHCYNPSSGCNQTGLRLPLLEYGHVNGQCAIIGGYVYRGNSIPALNGRYIYGDYCTGSIWDFDTRFSPSSTNALLISSGKQMSAYGVDKHQELYLCSYNDGIIYKFTAIPPDRKSVV